jgi:hypothetical protein
MGALREAMDEARSASVWLLLLLTGCSRVEVEPPLSGRALSREERRTIERVADATFREATAVLPGLPKRLTLIVRWGRDVIPETGETGAAAYPGNIGWTIDPDRDVLATVRTQLRPTLLHELHHLARASRILDRTLLDHVVTEGLATAFERDTARTDPPWGRAPDSPWVSEVLALPPDADVASWLRRHPDGRRFVGMRVGTQLVDRACSASGMTPATLVFTESAEVIRLGR